MTLALAEPGTQKQQQAVQAVARWRAVIMLQLDSEAFAEPHSATANAQPIALRMQGNWGERCPNSLLKVFSVL
jgi:hypothetical protein